MAASPWWHLIYNYHISKNPLKSLHRGLFRSVTNSRCTLGTSIAGAIARNDTKKNYLVCPLRHHYIYAKLTPSHYNLWNIKEVRLRLRAPFFDRVWFLVLLGMIFEGFCACLARFFEALVGDVILVNIAYIRRRFTTHCPVHADLDIGEPSVGVEAQLLCALTRFSHIARPGVIGSK